MRRALLALLLALGAAPALAQGAPSPARIDAFIAAAAGIGCVINEANNLALLARLAMTEAEGSAIVVVLMAEGRAVPQDDDLRIVAGACS